jgi:holo-[acyl-carrier protein] synthase
MCEDAAVGVDLVEVKRMARAMQRQPRFLERVFTQSEIETCLGSAGADERFAARFAAKEATFKALGKGWPQIGYRDVEVALGESGVPRLELRGKALSLADQRHAAVSLSHTGGFAIAHVMLTGAPS